MIARHCIEGNDFNRDLDRGRLIEERVAGLYEERGGSPSFPLRCSCPVPYDFVVETPPKGKPDGRPSWFSVEVKTCGCDGAFFETRSAQTGIPPEYIRHAARVDRLVRYNTLTGVAAEIDNAVLVALLTKHVGSLGGDGGYTERLNRMGTAWGTVLNIFDADIGFLRVL